MGNPFTMMDEYHQRYWQNYHAAISNPRNRGLSDHEIHKAIHGITQREEGGKKEITQDGEKNLKKAKRLKK